MTEPRELEISDFPTLDGGWLKIRIGFRPYPGDALRPVAANVENMLETHMLPVRIFRFHHRLAAFAHTQSPREIITDLFDFYPVVVVSISGPMAAERYCADQWARACVPFGEASCLIVA